MEAYCLPSISLEKDWFRQIILKIYYFLSVFLIFTGDQKIIKNSVCRVNTEADAERILKDYGNSILRMAYSYLHNMSDAEDILQDTLIRYLQKMPDFADKNHEKAWLLCVAANLSKNKIDYNRLRDTDELDENLIAKERGDLSFVWEAVRELPPNYSEVIHLFYHEGYATSEIAKILRRKESSIRSDLRRGREKLKIILKEAYDFE